MDELLRQSYVALRGMWNHRWLGMAVAWAVGLVGMIVIAITPDKYEASTRIYVNTASILKPLMTGLTVLPNDEQQIAMLSRIVISRPNVETLIQALGLDADAKSKAAYETLVDDVIKALKIQGGGRDNIYVLTYRDTNPERSKRGMQFFSSLFIESGHVGKTTDTDAAKKFIDEQIVLYDGKLREAETRLKEFKLKSLGVTSGEGANYFARLAETTALLEKAQLELREAENTRDAFKRGLASEEPNTLPNGSLPNVSSGMVAEVEARLDAMRRNLDILLQKYTEKHPDVVGAQRVIRELEDQRKLLLASRRNEGAPIVSLPSGTGPRASEQLKVSLASAEASVASLRARVTEYSNRYAKLKASATMIPQLEAELAQLNRDYEVNKKNYESLVTRRESASMSGEMQSVAGVADFRVIDPPRVSPKPVAPNRTLLFPAAFLLAIGAGVAAAFAAKEIRPQFFDGKSVSDVTGLPLLGTVTLIVREDQKLAARRSVTKFVGAFGALLASYLAGFAAIAMFSARAV